MQTRTSSLAERSGFSRRDFLRGSGAVAAATAISHETTAALAQEQGTKIVSGAAAIQVDDPDGGGIAAAAIHLSDASSACPTPVMSSRSGAQPTP